MNRLFLPATQLYTCLRHPHRWRFTGAADYLETHQALLRIGCIAAIAVLAGGFGFIVSVTTKNPPHWVLLAAACIFLGSLLIVFLLHQMAVGLYDVSEEDALELLNSTIPESPLRRELVQLLDQQGLLTYAQRDHYERLATQQRIEAAKSENAIALKIAIDAELGRCPTKTAQ